MVSLDRSTQMIGRFLKSVIGETESARFFLRRRSFYCANRHRSVESLFAYCRRWIVPAAGRSGQIGVDAAICVRLSQRRQCESVDRFAVAVDSLWSSGVAVCEQVASGCEERGDELWMAGRSAVHTVRRGIRASVAPGGHRPARTPPSTGRMEPVIQPACFEAKKAIAATTSAVVPIRPMG